MYSVIINELMLNSPTVRDIHKYGATHLPAFVESKKNEER